MTMNSNSIYKPVILVFLTVVTVVLYERFQIRNVDRFGLITIAYVKEYVSAKSGGSYSVDIYLKEKKIKAKVASGYCERNCTGNYYFVKVLENDPTKNIILYEDKMVPKCIIEKVHYFKGWNYFPGCDNY
jgi:hypothetical protein